MLFLSCEKIIFYVIYRPTIDFFFFPILTKIQLEIGDFTVYKKYKFLPYNLSTDTKIVTGTKNGKVIFNWKERH